MISHCMTGNNIWILQINNLVAHRNYDGNHAAGGVVVVARVALNIFVFNLGMTEVFANN